MQGMLECLNSNYCLRIFVVIEFIHTQFTETDILSNDLIIFELKHVS